MITILFALLSCVLAGFIPLELHRGNASNFTNSTVEYFRARDKTYPAIINQTSLGYFAALSVGSNHQTVHALLDTGSSDLWFLTSNKSCYDEICPGMVFNPEESTTFEDTNATLWVTYGSGVMAYGPIAKDTVTIGDASVDNVYFGVPNATNGWFDLLGVGYPQDNTTDLLNGGASTYDSLRSTSLPFALRDRGLINTVAYSLYLNEKGADYGNVVFGGVDHAKYSGTLGIVPIVSDSFFNVMFHGINVTYADGSTCSLVSNMSISTLFDSGTALAVLPNEILVSMAGLYGYSYNAAKGYYEGQCTGYNFDSFTLDFSGVKVNLPADSVLLDSGDANAPCYLGVVPTGMFTSEDPIIGDVFLKQFYVVFDMEHREVALAQARFTNDTDIEEIVSTVPRATTAPSYYSTLTYTDMVTHDVKTCRAASTTSVISSTISSASSTPTVASAVSSTQFSGLVNSTRSSNINSPSVTSTSSSSSSSVISATTSSIALSKSSNVSSSTVSETSGTPALSKSGNVSSSAISETSGTPTSSHSSELSSTAVETLLPVASTEASVSSSVKPSSSASNYSSSVHSEPSSSSLPSTPVGSVTGNDTLSHSQSSVTSITGASITPTSRANESQTFNSTGSAITTYVVDSFVTTCPSPTTFSTNGQTYTATESTVITVTNCPCTLTQHAPATRNTTTTEVVESFVTTCSSATTFSTNGHTYTATENEVVTVSNCPCTLTKTNTPSGNLGESYATATQPKGSTQTVSSHVVNASENTATRTSNSANTGSGIHTENTKSTPSSSAPINVNSGESASASNLVNTVSSSIENEQPLTKSTTHGPSATVSTHSTVKGESTSQESVSSKSSAVVTTSSELSIGKKSSLNQQTGTVYGNAQASATISSASSSTTEAGVPLAASANPSSIRLSNAASALKAMPILSLLIIFL